MIFARKLMVMVLFGLLTIVAAAHDGHKHGTKTVMGTVQTVEKTQVSIKTTKGKSMAFVLNGTTKIVKMKGRKPGTRDDLKQGVRVAVKFDASTTPPSAVEIMVAGTSHGSHSHGEHEGMEHNH